MLPPTRRTLNRVGAVFAALLAWEAVALAEDRFQVPSRGAVLSAGASVSVRWTGLPEASEQELVLSLDGGLTFPIRLSPELSPRAGGYRWIVPDLPSARARLAVRSGEGEGSEEEVLRIVSDEFTIVASGWGDGGELLRGAREGWTRQALLSSPAEDPFGEEMGTTVQANLSEDWLEVADPDSRDAAVSDPLTAGLVAAPRVLPLAASRVVASGFTVPLPLRL